MSETLPPPDWIDRIWDYAQVKNVLNGDTITVSPDDTPVAWRLVQFFDDPEVAEAWRKFNEGVPRL